MSCAVRWSEIMRNLEFRIMTPCLMRCVITPRSASLKLMKLKNCLTNIISISTALITTAVCTSLRSVSSMNCRQGIHYFIRTFATS